MQIFFPCFQLIFFIAHFINNDFIHAPKLIKALEKAYIKAYFMRLAISSFSFANFLGFFFCVSLPLTPISYASSSQRKTSIKNAQRLYRQSRFGRICNDFMEEKYLKK